MPTPASGAISMNDMRTHINRATGSAISMSEMRTRYGFPSGGISFADLYDVEGFVVTIGSVTNKFGTDEGWRDQDFEGIGSVSPNESGTSLGRVQVAAASWLQGLFSPGLANTTFQLSITENTTAQFGQGDLVTAGYRATDLTRIVIANTAYAFTGYSNSSVSYATGDYNFPASGTVHCLVKF
jgi:hypothetical protein